MYIVYTLLKYIFYKFILNSYLESYIENVI